MVTSRGFMKCLFVALIVGAAIAFTVSLTAGLLLGLAIAVGSISSLPVASTDTSVGDRERWIEIAPDQQPAAAVNPGQPGAPSDKPLIVMIAQPKQLPLSDTTERGEDAHQSARRKR